MKSEEFSKNIL